MNTLSRKQRIGIPLIYFFAQEIVAILAISLNKGKTPAVQQVVWIQFSSLLIVALLILFIVKRNLIYDLVIAQHTQKLLKTILKWVGIAYGTMLVVNFVLYQIHGDVTSSLNQSTVEIMFKQSPIIMFFVVVILAPVVEELVFRYAFIKPDSKNVFISLLISSFLFGFIHIMGAVASGNMTEWWNMLVYGGLGLVLGLSYISTKTIFVPILVHAVFNLVGYLMMFV